MTYSKFVKKYNGLYVDATGKAFKTAKWDNSNFRGQCASLARRYLVDVLGKPDRAYGNGKQFDETLTSMDFRFVNLGKNLSKAKKGDILVWDNLGSYGHVAMFHSKNKMFSANPNAAKVIPIWSGVTDIIRYQPIPKIKLYSKPQKYKAKTKVNVRTTPIVALNNKKPQFTPKQPSRVFIGECSANGIIWLVRKLKNGEYRFIAKKYLKKV